MAGTKRAIRRYFMSFMKNKFMAALLAMTFAVLIGSCASSQTVVQVESMEQAALKVHEGDYYLKEFERFTKGEREIYYPFETKGSPSEEYRPSNPRPPSERDIDRAIACYEEALRLQPTGTWTLPKKHSGYIENTNMSARPPEGGVQAKLENARRIKQQWLAQ